MGAGIIRIPWLLGVGEVGDQKFVSANLEYLTNNYMNSPLLVNPNL